MNISKQCSGTLKIMIRKDTSILHDSSSYYHKKKFTPEKYRGHSLEILGILENSTGMTVSEISDKTGLQRGIVKVYCWRGFHNGILEIKDRFGYCISPSGMLVLQTKQYNIINNHNTKVTEQLHKGNTNEKKSCTTVKRIDLESFKNRDDITEPMQRVVAMLTSHFNRTEIKFMYFVDIYDFIGKADIDQSEIKEVMCHLVEEGIIYKKMDSIGWKIGLKKKFVEQNERNLSLNDKKKESNFIIH